MLLENRALEIEKEIELLEYEFKIALLNHRYQDAEDIILDRIELENELREAPLNDGKNNEVEKVMSSSIFAKAYRNLLNKIHVEYINNEICLIRRFWNILREEKDAQ